MSSKDDLVEFLNKTYSDARINSLDTIDELLYFSLYWNHIEAGQSLGQFEVIKTCIESKIFPENEIGKWQLRDIFRYFHSRYNGDHYSLDSLIKRQNWIPTATLCHRESKAIIYKMVEEVTQQEQILFVSYVVSRFRNRLFHGEKQTVSDQNENFRIINKFLHYLLTQ